MNILAIETSCDETACAVVRDGTKIISNVIASSSAVHAKFGGIVPEVAAREQIKCIIPVINEALNNNSYDAIAVTVGPGLIGSLLVGVEAAKTLAFVTGKPLIPVNHVLAHMYANFVESSQQNSSRVLSEVEGSGGNIGNIVFPAISLVVSGGHTELFLMSNEKELKWIGGTLDDAAGEAFDKTARLLEFGNRGGVAIQEFAQQFSTQHSAFSIHLPRPMLHDETLNFSFSGLKTAVMREWKKYEMDSGSKAGMIGAFAREVQEAITDVLVAKAVRAAEQHHAKSILVSGGVAANLKLREKFMAHNSQFTIHVPPVPLCTDNAVYIASYAFFRGEQTDWHEVTAQPDMSVEI